MLPGPAAPTPPPVPPRYDPGTLPSPLAHVAVALAAGLAAPAGSPLRARRAWLAAAAASVAADGDLLLAATLPGGMAWHHGPTHSLLGGAALGAAVGLAAGLRGRPLAWAAAMGLLHPLLDAELGAPGEPATFGVPLLWPFSATRFVSPVPIFRPFGIHQAGFLWHMVSAEALGPYLREAGFAGLVITGAVVVRRWREARIRRLGSGAPAGGGHSGRYT